MKEQYDAIVIGSGKGGKTLAVDLGKNGVKTALLERSAEMIGGTCINVGCIPTKAFIAASRAAHAARDGARYGVHCRDIQISWTEVRQRVENVVREMRAMNEKNFHAPPKLDFILGTGRFLSATEVEVTSASGESRHLEAPKIFINTGTRPARQAIPGIEAIGELALDSNTVQRLDALPEHLIVMGGGYIALEFAQMFRRLGSKVTVIERGGQLLGREDADMVEALTDALRAEAIDIRVKTSVNQIARGSNGGVAISFRANDQPGVLTGSHLLFALGRSAVTEELNLPAAGVDTDDRGFIKVNDRLETSAPGVWAIGDVNGGPQFTHASLDDYRLLKANVFGNGNRSSKDRLIPFSLFTEPEFARVGLTEKAARDRGLDILVAKVPAAVIPRARTSGRTTGLLKAVVDAKTLQILGCAIFAESAGETISAVQMAMLANATSTHLKDAILTHPTMTEGLNNLFSALG